MTFKKGDRVFFIDDGEPVYGVVSRGGKTVTVVLDGGLEELRGGPAFLKKCNQPLPSDPPHKIDDWDVVNYKVNNRASEETICFSATITFKGEKVLGVSNDGKGGANNYVPLEAQYSKCIQELKEVADEWMSHHGCSDALEPEAVWVAWKAEFAKYGMKGSDYISEFKKEIEEIGYIDYTSPGLGI